MYEVRPLKIVPALTIELNIHNGCEIIVWRGAEVQNHVLKISNPGISQVKLGSLRRDFHERITRFAELLRGPLRATIPQFEVRESMAALWELHDFGYYLLQQLLGPDNDKALPILTDLTRVACTGPTQPKSKWDNPRWNKDAPPLNLIVVRTAVDSGIPFDMLPLLDYDPDIPRTSSDLQDLGKLVCCFLGFSAIVKRQVGKSVGSANILENTDRLPVKMFIYRNSRGSLKQEDNLRYHSHIDADEAWPNAMASPSQADFAGQLARHLWEAKTRFGTARKFPDQICHFSCHSETTPNLPASRYEIQLHNGDLVGGTCTVDLLSLTNALSRLRTRNEKDQLPRPFVFLNSCGSGSLDPSAAGSFPELFLSQRFCGFIGTETIVPENFAAEFAREFYENLLHAGTVGKAFLLARWNLLKAYNNPMGLIYTLFAEPEIGVRQPIPEDDDFTIPGHVQETRLSKLVAGVGRMFSGSE